MAFSSIPFLFFFLPVFCAVYFIVPAIRGKNIVALAFSLLFYMWGEPWFVLVLLGSISLNMCAALGIDQLHGYPRRLLLILTVSANLGLLGLFKYANFLAANLNVGLHLLGLQLGQPEIPLPLGISFFTFHCLSYVIDVYRRRFPANRNLIEVALYIALFPQLVAGPIVRYTTVARQLHFRRHSLFQASAGARIFIIGLAQKVLLADQLAPLSNAVFDHVAHPSCLEAWMGLLAYSLQIYFDFAGYSNMAIGLGIALGFTFPRNFRLPYTSLSITEFWRRWHMSLSAWLRDYLYIPLGGSRNGRVQTYRNLLTVFLLCGLWHGANWTFVLWGVWHGAFLILERIGLGRRLRWFPVAGRWLYALLVVMGGWVLFRAENLQKAGEVYAGLLGRNGVSDISFDVHSVLTASTMIPLGVGCAFAVLPRWIRIPKLPTLIAAPADAICTFAMLALTMIYVAAGSYSPFLYFRF